VRQEVGDQFMEDVAAAQRFVRTLGLAAFWPLARRVSPTPRPERVDSRVFAESALTQGGLRNLGTVGAKSPGYLAAGDCLEAPVPRLLFVSR